jgi:hypothetical protein
VVGGSVVDPCVRNCLAVRRVVVGASCGHEHLSARAELINIVVEARSVNLFRGTMVTYFHSPRLTRVIRAILFVKAFVQCANSSLPWYPKNSLLRA